MVASAVFVLLVDPEQLWHIGFQLSYLVVFSILLFGLPLYQSLTNQFRPFKFLPNASLGPWRHATIWMVDKTTLLFAISFAAWLISAPLGSGFFGYLSPYAVAVNLLLVNLAALAISTGVLALGCAVLSVPALAWFLNHSAWLTIDLMEKAVDLNLRMPFAVIECPNFPKSLSYLTVFLFGILLLITNSTGRTKIAFLAGPIIIFLGLALGLLQN
jgi:competence protein ComEC